MRVLIVALIFIVGITVAYFLNQPSEKPLKIYNPVDVESEMVEKDLARKGYGHTIQEFSFTDQTGKSYGSKDLKGKIYVAEYFFTTCGTICPRMNQEMMRVQKAYQRNEQFKILSFTVDPETDSVAQMKIYADGHGADPKQWHFLTGDKKDLYKLARRSFFVLKPAEAANQGDVGSDFIHTNYFVLVDTKKQIRGYYDGTSSKEVDKLIGDIGKLLEEK
ncbi:SCO family protein [Fluviicola taffensis]|uniref:Electron transport protein SCO1/SenC n=1 Tax=Fluviicola taffensis (strain DSM 16823 / NCIMB 13979 / RW262) TaxID=755732 RepID=F2IEF9_FLUTR|nr:SCO family protein [Fluviicola taffensis]AEA43483.1 electron transport protein SCO1/SenC [Fluviicola taffensis DSM 16823]